MSASGRPGRANRRVPRSKLVGAVVTIGGVNISSSCQIDLTARSDTGHVRPPDCESGARWTILLKRRPVVGTAAWTAPAADAVLSEPLNGHPGGEGMKVRTLGPAKLSQELRTRTSVRAAPVNRNALT